MAPKSILQSADLFVEDHKFPRLRIVYRLWFRLLMDEFVKRLYQQTSFWLSMQRVIIHVCPFAGFLRKIFSSIESGIDIPPSPQTKETHVENAGLCYNCIYNYAFSTLLGQLSA